MNEAERMQNALLERYAQIVSLGELQDLAKTERGLGGLFLPGVPDGYTECSRRVMLVGKETRGWGGGLARTIAGLGPTSDVRSYLNETMRLHARYLRAPQAGSKFFQFFRELSARLDAASPDGSSIIWANLFCMSYLGKSPVRAKLQFERIARLSRELLLAQIEVLRPDAIFFVTGAGYDKHLKSVLAVRNESVRVSPKRLWCFETAGRIPCFRTAHPQWEPGRDYRDKAIKLALATPSKRASLIAQWLHDQSQPTSKS